jgi:hypothetical protein
MLSPRPGHDIRTYWVQVGLLASNHAVHSEQPIDVRSRRPIGTVVHPAALSILLLWTAADKGGKRRDLGLRQLSG